MPLRVAVPMGKPSWTNDSSCPNRSSTSLPLSDRVSKTYVSAGAPVRLVNPSVTCPADNAA